MEKYFVKSLGTMVYLCINVTPIITSLRKNKSLVFISECPGVAGLNICRMDRNAGCSTGHEEVFLLCDKVQKGRFFCLS